MRFGHEVSPPISSLGYNTKCTSESKNTVVIFQLLHGPCAVTYIIVSTQTLHHHMTENDLDYFFGVDNHLEVPEYDVIIPHQLDERGLPLHDQRQRRSDESRENIFYKVPAFGRELHLNLTLNRKLMSPNVVVETRHADGTVSRAPAPKNTYYLGHVVSDPHSLVSVSDERGLTGMLKLLSDTLFIHPLPTHLAKRAVPSEEKATPHLIYKRSLQIQVDAQRTQREIVESAKKSDETNKGSMKMKTLEAFLMLEADTAARLQREHQSPQQFLLLLGNIISGLFMDPSIGEIRIYYVVSGIIVIDKKVLGAEYSDSKDTWMTKLEKYLRALNNPDNASPEHFDVCSLVYSMGVAHDGNSVYCPGSTFIMSPVLPGGASAESWSVCSSRTIQAFLRSARSWCLNDEAQNKAAVVFKKVEARSIPGNIAFDTPEVLSRTVRDTIEVIDLKKFNEEKQLIKLPGEVMSADDQCALQYGDNYGQCHQKMNDCGHLWCTSDGYSCLSRNAPVADGTPCGSRNACPETAVNSYRDEQCVKARGVGSSAYYYGNPCDLFCKRGNTATRYGAVADGTRCKKDSSVYDVCISGVCKAAGCNQVLGSNQRIDRCGVCGGNGNTCKHVKDVYIKQWDQIGKQNADLIVELPPGTMSATFLEKSATYNKIGIMTKDGDFLINPDTAKNVKLSYAGANIIYTKKKKRYADRLVISGPTTAKLKIMFIAVYGENTGVECELLYHVNHKIKLHYRWIVGDWSTCSATCAGGFQRREVRCVLMEDGSAASDEACDQSQWPNDEHECNQQPCPPEWQVTDWTPCSKTCGTGIQTRKMKCHQRVSFHRYQEISSYKCDSSKLPDVSQLSRTCNKILCKAEWKIESKWSACSTPCGPGFRHRVVNCILIDEDGRPSNVTDEQCALLDKPTDNQQCDEKRICLKDGNYQCYPTSPCENDAICVEQPPSNYKCECLEGFKGRNCEVEVDPCDKSPCHNGATCQRDSSSSHGYVCTCPEWYKGKHCGLKAADKTPVMAAHAARGTLTGKPTTVTAVPRLEAERTLDKPPIEIAE
ncbi:hypothetical protein ACROYT_G026876 [Oculina patagonica]